MFGRSRTSVVTARTPGELDAMEAAGRIVGRALVAAREAAVPGASTAAIARRIFAISCLEPIRLGVFLPATQLFQGYSVERALQKARDETLGATWRSWAVFTVPLFVGFRYLRPENRVPLLSAVGACWNTYLSWLAST